MFVLGREFLRGKRALFSWKTLPWCGHRLGSYRALAMKWDTGTGERAGFLPTALEPASQSGGCEWELHTGGREEGEQSSVL